MKILLMKRAGATFLSPPTRERLRFFDRALKFETIALQYQPSIFQLFPTRHARQRQSRAPVAAACSALWLL
jgi:hypothetical protein